MRMTNFSIIYCLTALLALERRQFPRIFRFSNSGLHLTMNTKPFRHSKPFILEDKRKLTNHEHIHFLSTVVTRRKQIFSDSSGLRKQFNPVRGSRKMENFFFSLWIFAFATQSGIRWRHDTRWGVTTFLKTAFLDSNSKY